MKWPRIILLIFSHCHLIFGTLCPQGRKSSTLSSSWITSQCNTSTSEPRNQKHRISVAGDSRRVVPARVNLTRQLTHLLIWGREGWQREQTINVCVRLSPDRNFVHKQKGGSTVSWPLWALSSRSADLSSTFMDFCDSRHIAGTSSTSVSSFLKMGTIKNNRDLAPFKAILWKSNEMIYGQWHYKSCGVWEIISIRINVSEHID